MSKDETIKGMEMALREALAQVHPAAQLDWKSLFGGAGFFVNGRIFAAWFGASLALKLPPDAARDLLQIEGAASTLTRQYVEVPLHYLDEPELLFPWVERSVAYVTAQPARKRARRKPSADKE